MGPAAFFFRSPRRSQRYIESSEDRSDRFVSHAELHTAKHRDETLQHHARNFRRRLHLVGLRSSRVSLWLVLSQNVIRDEDAKRAGSTGYSREESFRLQRLDHVVDGRSGRLKVTANLVKGRRHAPSFGKGLDEGQILALPDRGTRTLFGHGRQRFPWDSRAGFALTAKGVRFINPPTHTSG